MLFDHENDDFASSDVATRALSVTAVENAFVNRVYEKLANVYDIIFGPSLHHGRLVAIERMAIKRGDRVLEVGVGTGINTSLYPNNCTVTGIDLSSSMLDKARERVRREGLRHVRLQEMDAAHLIFADNTFDIVYAPYTISVSIPAESACSVWMMIASAKIAHAEEMAAAARKQRTMAAS